MSLIIDKQTLDDLNIFGRRNNDSVYAIFNHTHTRVVQLSLNSYSGIHCPMRHPSINAAGSSGISREEDDIPF